jgi:alcohol dehydrogenase class IV
MFDKIYQYNFPTTIRFGAGAVEELPEYLQKNNLKSPLIVTDPVVASLDFFRKSSQTSNKKISLLMFLLTSIKTQ